MPKSRVRKKKGKPVKYTPKPSGISKTKMKKFMEMMDQYKKIVDESKKKEEDNVEDQVGLIIPGDHKKKMDFLSVNEIHSEGPELSEKNESAIE